MIVEVNFHECAVRGFHVSMDNELNIVCNNLVNTIYEATKKATVAPSTPNPRPPENATTDGIIFSTPRMTNKYGSQ